MVAANAAHADTSRPGSDGYMLPYQVAWIRDESPVAFFEKSRRVGADWAEAFCAVSVRMSGKRKLDYWYSSADESAAVEFMGYIKFFLKLYGEAYKLVEETDLYDDNDARVMTVLLPEIGGRRTRITVLTSNPTQFRSKGGDVTISELAFHKNAEALWKAAVPATAHGGRLRVISSHNGESSLFNRLIEQAKKYIRPEEYGEPRETDLKASLHYCNIEDAVDQGLVEALNARNGTDYTRDGFIEELKRKTGDALVWLEEFLCVVSKQSMSYLPLSLYNQCVHKDAAVSTGNLGDFIAAIGQRAKSIERITAGCDVARTNDRFVIWVYGRVGSQRLTLGVFVARGIDFEEMETAITVTMTNTVFRVLRICIDKTGLGMQLAERMEKKFRGRAEGVTMTGTSKEDMFTRLRAGMEERTVGLPDDTECKADFSTVRRELTGSNNVRYSAIANEHGHADRATAAALGLVADESGKKPARFVKVRGVA